MRNDFLQRLRPASWRGVPFEVKAEESDFGRNIVVHEFVQRDKPYVEDLGRKTRKLKLEMWICANADNGFNPHPQRDALIAAVERPGIGTLVHPWYGTLQGHLHSLHVKQASTEGGGFIGLQGEFVESGELEFRATVVQDTLGRVTSSAERVYSAAQAEFASAFSVRGVQAFVLDDARASLKQLISTTSGLLRGRNLAAQIAGTQIAGFGTLGDAYSLGQDIVRLVQDVADPPVLHLFDRPAITSTATVGRQRQAQNQQALVHLVRIASLARAADLASDLGANSPRYSADSVALRSTPALLTRSELQALRRSTADTIMAELMELSSLQIYPESQQALLQLRTDAVQHMTAEGETLASTFTTNCCDGTDWAGTMPTLVLAYRWYGVLSDDVINARNCIPNPLFIAPHARVELLSQAA